MDIQTGVSIILNRWLGVKRDDLILLITDETHLREAEAFEHWALGADAVLKTVMLPQEALSPPPMPGQPSPPFAVIQPSLMRMLPQLIFHPPPMPAPPLLLASSAPVPWIVSVLPDGTKMPG